MTRIDCPRELETLEALAARRLPGRAGADLLSHVNVCEICRDLIDVITAIQHTGEEDSTVVPSAATVWWRAQLRARRDAARKAAAPITAAQVAAVVVAIAVLTALRSDVPEWTPALPFGREALLSWWPGMPSTWPSVSWPSIPWPSFGAVPPLTVASVKELSRWWWLGGVLLLWLAVAPIAVYLAGVED